MKNTWILATALFATFSFAFAEDAPRGTATSGAGAQSPTDTCKTMVQAATADDFDKIVANTANYGGKKEVKKGEKEFEKKRGSYMSKLKDIQCGSEHIAGTRAMVEAETQGEKRFIPFVQEGGKWKFDARTYMSFYPPKDGMGHGYGHGKGHGKGHG